MPPRPCQFSYLGLLAYHSASDGGLPMRRRIVLGGLLIAGTLSIVVAAQQAQPKPSASAIKVEKLDDNLFLLNALAAGGGGNTSVFVTATGVVVVDTKHPGR